jgi:hypothetical protein
MHACVHRQFVYFALSITASVVVHNTRATPN